MRVAMVTRFYLSGQTSRLVTLAINLVRRGHPVHIYFTSFVASEYRREYARWLEEENVGWSVDDELRLGKRQWDVLHAHSSRTFQRAAYRSRQYGMPLVLTAHGLGLEGEKYRPAMRRADRIICVGEKVCESLTRYAPKTVLVPNYVDLREYRPAPAPSLVAIDRGVKLVVLGRYDKFKSGGAVALKGALLRLCREYSDLQVTMLGNWPPEVRASGWQHCGWVIRPAEYLGDADIVIGAGLAAREAMASGSAVVVLSRGYWGIVKPERIRDMTPPNLSGWTHEEVTKPDEEVVYEDLRGLLSNRGYLQYLKDWGRKYAERTFDAGSAIKKTLGVYREARASREGG